MNCKPGDLAIFVRSYCGNEGRIVRVLRLATDVDRKTIPWEEGRCCWVIDQTVSWGGGGLVFARAALALDDCLRPIRDTDGEDEMLRIAGRPETVEA
jgi:hypothetical protein